MSELDVQTDAPARLELMGIPDDLLAIVVTQLCGGQDVHDIACWKHACQLAQTCTTWARLVLNSDHCKDEFFFAEYVGPDVLTDEDDPFKTAVLRVDRAIWHYEPKITVKFTYGGVSRTHRAVPPYVHALHIKVSLLLEDVLRVFYKPPGWQAAAKLALSCNEHLPWSACFPVNKLPEPPERVRVCGTMQAKYVVERKDPIVDARGQRWYDESTVSLSLPATTHVVATCSTVVKEFRRGERAHYVEDLEIGLNGMFTPEFLALPTIRNFFEALELDLEEPPDLYYRFNPWEARQLASYPYWDYEAKPSPATEAARAALHDLAYPPKPRKQRLHMLRSQQDSSDEEEFDPEERRRQKQRARAAISAQLKDEALGERHHTRGSEHVLPARTSPAAVPIPGSAAATLLAQQAAAAYESDSESNPSLDGRAAEVQLSDVEEESPPPSAPPAAARVEYDGSKLQLCSRGVRVLGSGCTKCAWGMSWKGHNCGSRGCGQCRNPDYVPSGDGPAEWQQKHAQLLEQYRAQEATAAPAAPEATAPSAVAYDGPREEGGEAGPSVFSSAYHRQLVDSDDESLSDIFESVGASTWMDGALHMRDARVDRSERVRRQIG